MGTNQDRHEIAARLRKFAATITAPPEMAEDEEMAELMLAAAEELDPQTHSNDGNN